MVFPHVLGILYSISKVSLGLFPFPVIVTTRIFTFATGGPEINLYIFATIRRKFRSLTSDNMDS